LYTFKQYYIYLINCCSEKLRFFSCGKALFLLSLSFALVSVKLVFMYINWVNVCIVS